MRRHPSYYARRAITDTWSNVTPRYTLRKGTLDLAISGATSDGALLIDDWKPSWKTATIGKALASRCGAFVDIGANIGQTLLDFLVCRKGDERYIGFEPNPKCAEMVASIIRDNDIADAVLVPIGLADRSALLPLFFGANSTTDSGATLVADLRPSKAVKQQWVPCLTFDAAAADLAVNDIALIKIDVEGGEGEVLSGMRETLRTKRPWVMCEVLHRDPLAEETAYRTRLASIEALLGELDFRMYRIVRSRDDSQVEDIVSVAAFPDAVWSEKSSAECDYLFCPAETNRPSI